MLFRSPDMRHPIFGALVWPEYKENYLEPFDLAGNSMTFFAPRFNDFPLLSYAYTAAEKGNSYTIAFNAANEVAVHAFLEKTISFSCISKCVNFVLQSDWNEKASSLEAILESDKKARVIAKKFLSSGGF